MSFTKHYNYINTNNNFLYLHLSLAYHHRHNLRQQIQHVQCMRSRRSTTHRLYSTSCYIHRTSLRSAALLSQDHHTQVGKTNLVSIHRPGIAGAARTWYISFCTLSKWGLSQSQLCQPLRESEFACYALGWTSVWDIAGGEHYGACLGNWFWSRNQLSVFRE